MTATILLVILVPILAIVLLSLRVRASNERRDEQRKQTALLATIAEREHNA